MRFSNPPVAPPRFGGCCGVGFVIRRQLLGNRLRPPKNPNNQDRGKTKDRLANPQLRVMAEADHAAARVIDLSGWQTERPRTTKVMVTSSQRSTEDIPLPSTLPAGPRPKDGNISGLRPRGVLDGATNSQWVDSRAVLTITIELYSHEFGSMPVRVQHEVK